MTPEQQNTLYDDFLAWSGGFDPDSPEEIETYLTLAMPSDLNEDEARTYLQSLLS